MKIERKIILSKLIYLVLIVIIGGFAIQYLNSVSDKLQVPGDRRRPQRLLPEMRLSEKNYFLFNDDARPH